MTAYRHQSSWAAWVVLALLLVAASGSALAGLPQQGHVPEFEIPTVASPPALDGRLDDPCWQEALVSWRFYPSGELTPADQPVEGTTLYLTQYADSLFIGVDCRGASDPATDSIQVFLDPLHSHEFSYVFTVHRNGQTEQDTWADPDWVKATGHWEAAVRNDDAGWSAEARIDLTHLPFLRMHADAVGLLVMRNLSEEKRLVWGLNDTRRGLMPFEPGLESFWACHIRGLDVAGLIAKMDAENESCGAPLAPRVAALRAATGSLLADTSLPPETRMKALSLAIWAEDLDPKRRQCVERMSLRGLGEREEYLHDAEMLAAILSRSSRSGAEALPSLARLAADPCGPALWEINVARPIGRFQGRRFGVGVSFVGLPLAQIREGRARSADAAAKDRARWDKSLRAEGFEVRHERRGQIDLCFQSRPGGKEQVAYATEGNSAYDFAGVTPNGERSLADALCQGKPLDGAFVERLLDEWPTPVKVDGVHDLLAFPLPEASLVADPALELADPKLVRQLWRTLGDAKTVTALTPAKNPVVLLGAAPHDGALRRGGFDVDRWRREAAVGRVSVRTDRGRTVVGLWGRDRASLTRAVRVFRDMRSLLGTRELLVGDLHAHSVLSDGSGSPRQVFLAAMAAGMDFAALTDHNMADGARAAKTWCDELHLPFTVIQGEEVLGQGFEVIALGIDGWVKPQPDPRQMARDIHERGGLALLCHVGYPEEEPAKRLMAEFESLGLDGIDRQSTLMVDYAEEGDLISRQPLVTAVTDAHELVFGDPDRTLVFASDRSEAGILNAIRQGYVVALDPYGLRGPQRLVDVVKALVDERNYLTQEHRKRLEQRLNALSAAWQQGAL